MSLSEDSLEELNDLLSALSNEDDKAATVQSYLSQLSDKTPRKSQSIFSPPPDDEDENEAFVKLMMKHGLSPLSLLNTQEPLRPTPFNTDIVLCAYAKPSASEECLNVGTSTCSRCRLVKYCSKECQRQHWKAHAKDCKDPVLSSEWTPNWVRERRQPDFIGDPNTVDPLGMGQCLWGNMPALDVLNLPTKEIFTHSDIKLAFVASGDLRNLIRTINGLPLNYSGTVTVVLNDRDPLVTIRNILILRILGTISDKKRAVDMALHLWYSAFLPGEYYADILAQATTLMLSSHPINVQLGERSNLTADLDSAVQWLCAKLCSSSDTYGVSEAAATYYNMRFNASRVDLLHRRLLPLHPSHRGALLKYFRHGLLLPYGAHDAHFNVPNRFLFWHDGRWVQTDFATPTDGWNIEEVMASGKAHGTTREDLFGSCYYHVADQLCAFVDRLARFNMSIKVLNLDTTELLRAIAMNKLSSLGVPSGIHFDRIEVSNIMDLEYVGITRTLDAWAGLLKKTKDAAMVGYFMNWPRHQPDGRPHGTKNSTATLERLIYELIKQGRIALPSRDPSKPPKPMEMMGILGQLLTSCGEYDSVYDNSQPFDAFLARNGLDAALRRHKLMRRTQHAITPHRLCVAIDTKPSALPEFKDKESWYLHSTISGPTWFERFIEIGHARIVA